MDGDDWPIVLVVFLIIGGFFFILLVAANAGPTHKLCPKCGWEGNESEAIETTSWIMIWHSTGKGGFFTNTPVDHYYCPNDGTELNTVKGEWPPVNETTPNSFT